MPYTDATNVGALLVGVVAADIKALYLTMADNIINSKLGSRYVVPFTTTPPIIVTIATDIAAYYTMRALFTSDSQNKNEWTATYKESIKMLDEIAEGRVPVVDASGNELPHKTQSLSSNTQDFHTTFDMDNLDNSVIDNDLIDEIQGAK